MDPYRYFRIEARELLDELAAGLAGLRRGEPTSAQVGKLLRNAHTLKGAARVVSQAEIADHTHALEGLLEPFRSSAEPVPAEPLEEMLGELDEIGDLLRAIALPVAESVVEAVSVGGPTASAAGVGSAGPSGNAEKVFCEGARAVLRCGRQPDTEAAHRNALGSRPVGSSFGRSSVTQASVVRASVIQASVIQASVVQGSAVEGGVLSSSVLDRGGGAGRVVVGGFAGGGAAAGADGPGLAGRDRCCDRRSQPEPDAIGPAA